MYKLTDHEKKRLMSTPHHYLQDHKASEKNNIQTPAIGGSPMEGGPAMVSIGPADDVRAVW